MVKKRNGRRRLTRPKQAERQAKPRIDEVVLQADLPTSQRERFAYEPTMRPNPLGEVTIKGEIRRHKVCRRIPQYELLFRAKVFDKTVFAALEWFDDKLAMAEKGMTKCALNVTGGGGPGGTTFDEAAAWARSDVDWARKHIGDTLPVFDAVMLQGESFTAIGLARWPRLSPDWSKRRAARDFKTAATKLTDTLRDAGLLSG